MKSFLRFIAICSVFFTIALSCPAYATNAEETKTTAIFDDITLEVADFSKSNPLSGTLDFVIDKVKLKALVVESLKEKNFVCDCETRSKVKASVFVEEKRFPRAREYVNYVVLNGVRK